MGVSVDSGGGGGGKSVDIEINLVPFIDLMSCLVAFLLVTAVWTNLAQIKISPKGLGKDSAEELKDPPVNISVLVAQDSHWVGLSNGDRRQIPKRGDGEYDFTALQEVLKEYKNGGLFTERSDIEVAAEDGVFYQAIVSTMDSAIAEKFPDIGFVDPNSLSTRFKQ